MKSHMRFGIACMSICLAMALGGFAPARAEFVGKWTFDNCDGTDSSGNNNHGTLTGDPECVDGAFGKALELDGDGDCVDLGTSSAYDLATFSICASIYLSTDGRGFILAKRGSYEFGVDEDQQLNLGIWIGGGLWVGDTGETTIPFNQWTCVCVTYGAGLGGDGMRFYVNGQEVKFWQQTSNPNTNSNPTMIGYNYEAAAVHYWDGILDEVRLYDHVLSPSEVADYCLGDPTTYTSVQSGFWSSGDTWDKGTSPGCGDLAIITNSAK